MIDCPNSKIEYVISEYVHNKRDREILRLKWIDAETYHEIAERMEMSDRGVQYIVDRYRRKLLKYFV